MSAGRIGCACLPALASPTCTLDEHARVSLSRSLADRLALVAPGVVPLEGPIMGMRPGWWWFDPRGMARLGGEQALGERLCAAAHRRGHPGLQVIIAGAPLIARASLTHTLQRHDVDAEASTRLISDEEGLSQLHSLPLSVLSLSDHMATALHGLGIESVRQLAEMSHDAVVSRFGDEGRRVMDALSGQTLLRPAGSPGDTPVEISASQSLDVPVEQTAHLLFTLRGVADALAARLMCAGRAAAEVTLSLELADRSISHTHVRMGRATAEPSLLFDRLRDVLDGLSLDGPVAGIALHVAEGVGATPTQLALGAGRWSQRALESALARIKGRCGADAVVTPQQSADPRPERRGRWQVVQAAPTAPFSSLQAAAQQATPPARLRRRVQAPIAIEVQVEHERPVSIRRPGEHWRRCIATGPERISGGWWDDDAFAREDWHVRTTDQGVLWISRDARTGRWWWRGWID
ncbi:MAG: hypothetical protein ACE366_19840 [Bradymonadia bacterium]